MPMRITQMIKIDLLISVLHITGCSKALLGIEL